MSRAVATREPAPGPVAEPAPAGFDLDGLRQTGEEILARMRSLRELLEARAEALESCRVALESYHGEIRKETEQLALHEKELCEKFEARDAAITQRELTCAGQESTLAEFKQRHESLTAALESQEKTAAQRAKQLAAKETEVSSREASVAEIESRLTAERQALESQATAFAAQRAASEKLESTLTSRTRDLETREKELARQLRELKESEAALSQRAESTTLESRQIAERKAELDALGAELTRQKSELDRQTAEIAFLRDACNARKREMDAAAESVAALQKQLETELLQLTEAEKLNLPKLPPVPAAGTDEKPGDAKSRGAVERFQKLCRDARRKAIGN